MSNNVNVENVTQMFGSFSGGVTKVVIEQYKDNAGGVHETEKAAQESNFRLHMDGIAEKLIENGYAGESKKNHTTYKNVLADIASYMLDPSLKVDRTKPKSDAGEAKAVEPEAKVEEKPPVNVDVKQKSPEPQASKQPKPEQPVAKAA